MILWRRGGGGEVIKVKDWLVRGGLVGKITLRFPSRLALGFLEIEKEHHRCTHLLSSHPIPSPPYPQKSSMKHTPLHPSILLSILPSLFSSPSSLPSHSSPPAFFRKNENQSFLVFFRVSSVALALWRKGGGIGGGGGVVKDIHVNGGWSVKLKSWDRWKDGSR